MKLSKSFGQIFLHDKKYVHKIIDSLNVEGEVVVEIGPGSGIMTAQLIKKAKKLLCVEYDPRFYKLLSQRYQKYPDIKIIQSDILKFSFSRFRKKVIVFGNIPYHISNRLMHYLVENRKKIKKVHLTLQKEFAEKLSACVSTKTFSFLSCYLQYYARVRKVFDIPAGAFLPKPKVDSSFVEIDFYEIPPCVAKDEDFPGCYKIPNRQGFYLFWTGSNMSDFRKSEYLGPHRPDTEPGTYIGSILHPDY